MNDVSNILLSDGSILNLYADDMLLYKSMKSFEDVTCNWILIVLVTGLSATS